jgi:hypothetical protein
MHRPSSSGWLSDEWPAVAAISGAFALGWALVGANANVPVIDDWVYAWSVEHLVSTGRLRVLEYSAIYPVSQILWGSLFAGIAGFSFVALRLSTVTLSVIACVSVHATLREIGCRRSTALLGAMALAFDPVYFALSFSFMTEIPFICASALALYWFVRAVQREQTGALWLGGMFSVLAFLVRPIGIALPAAVLPSLSTRPDWRTSLKRSVWPLAAAIGVMAVLQLGLPRVLGATDWAATRRDYLRWWFTIPIRDYLAWTVGLLFVSAFPLVPILIPYLVRRKRLWQCGLACLALAVVCLVWLGEIPDSLPDWQTWSLQDIAARAMVDGPLGPSAWSVRAAPAVRLLGLLAMTSWSVGLVGGRRTFLRRGSAGLVVLTLAVLHVAMIHVLWLYNDRYYVVLAPLWAIMAAAALDGEGRARWLAVPLLAVWAFLAVTGTRDMLAYNEACARAAQALEAEGVAPFDIDAGYPVNGWRLYAHPENLPPGSDRRYDVPFVTSNRPTEYSVVNGMLPGGELVKEIPLGRATWQASRVLYLIRRRSAAR